MMDRSAIEPAVHCAGYGSAAYASSLGEFGTPTALAKSGAWLLARPIAGSKERDAIGCYPLFACRDWHRLADDLDDASDLVSVSAVTDPFGDYDEALLRTAFRDFVMPFKTHFVADLESEPAAFVAKHHQYYARKAQTSVKVEQCPVPLALLDDWCALYEHLIRRHRLAGIKAFSRAAFAKQLALPEIVMFCATEDDAIVGAHLWLVQNDVAYSHLAAANDRGYQLMAAYALYSYALDYFRGRVRYLLWGAGAGIDGSANDGLTQFKRGWSNTTRRSFLCGRIFDQTAYNRLVLSCRVTPGSYFPAYRAGEFS